MDLEKELEETKISEKAKEESSLKEISSYYTG